MWDFGRRKLYRNHDGTFTGERRGNPQVRFRQRGGKVYLANWAAAGMRTTNLKEEHETRRQTDERMRSRNQ